ncbi:wax ester/triacylglycerol synthase domain-containing protein, partial [Conexibacter stalactiti]
MERVSSISAALLQLESQAGQMHVGWVARVDAGAGGAPLDVGALRERVAQRLEQAPRFRHVVAPVDEHSGQLVWRDDPSFAVERHVEVCDEAVGGEDELRALVDGFLSQRFARERPLWRVLVVPRTRAGGAAIVGAAHRALCAGESTSTLRDLVFDRAGAGAGGRGARSARGVGGADDAGDDALALGEFRTAHRLGALAAARRDHGRIGATMRRAAYARTEGLLAPAPPSYLNAGALASGGARTLVTARLELGRLQRIAECGGTELHDVVLAIAAGALRRVALAAGQQPADLRALVPIDLGEHTLLGEEPCAVVELPVSERNPAARLRAIHATMGTARRPRRGGEGSGPAGAGGAAGTGGAG